MGINKNINTNKVNDNDKINTNVNIKIDLGDFNKPKPKPKKKTKPKPKTMDDMKTGATINTASSLAPVKMGGAKMPSPDNGFNPNNGLNTLLLTALQNAFNNRQLAPPQLPPSYAPQPPALPAPSQYPALPAPPQPQALPAPPQPQASRTPPNVTPVTIPPPTAAPTISSLNTQQYTTQGGTNIQPSTNIQLLPTPVNTQQNQINTSPQTFPNATGYNTVVNSPVNTQQMPNPNSSAPTQPDLAGTLSAVASQIQQNLVGALDAVTSILSPTRPQQPPPAPPAQPQQAPPAPPAPTAPTIGDWNKPLLQMFDSGKGKGTYQSLTTNQDMIKYADNVAFYLLDTNPDLETKIKQAIANPTEKRTAEAPGYRLYLPYLKQYFDSIPKDQFPYPHYSQSSMVSNFKKMFYERLKKTIYSGSDLSAVEAQEQSQIIADIAEEDSEDPTSLAGAALSVPSTLTTNAPTISTFTPPPPPPPPAPSGLAPPPPPPPPSGLASKPVSSSSTVSLQVTEKSIPVDKQWLDPILKQHNQVLKIPLTLPAFFIDIQKNDDLLDFQTEVINSMGSDEELVKNVKKTYEKSATKGKNLFMKALMEYGANFKLINEVPMRQWFWKEFAEQNDIDLSKEKEQKELSFEETERLQRLSERASSKSIGSKLNTDALRLKEIKTNYVQKLAEFNLSNDAEEKKKLKKEMDSYLPELLRLYGNEQNQVDLELQTMKKEAVIRKEQIEKARAEAEKERLKEIENERRAAEREARKKKK